MVIVFDTKKNLYQQAELQCLLKALAPIQTHLFKLN